MQVCTNGYISFGVAVPYIIYVGLFDKFFLTPLVAPYLIDIDYFIGVGKISYEVHTLTTSKPLLSKVNALINEHKETQFSGEWMLVAEWKDVLEFGFFDNVSFFIILNAFMYSIFILFPQASTFQAIITTDYISSFAVFTLL